MFAHIPKINAGLGCVVLLCFFLPWVSFSCGTVTFLKLSGYHLTAGKLPVDETVIRQYEQRSGRLADDDRVPREVKTPSRKYIYLVVLVCALNIIGFSLRMMEGEVDRFKSIAVIVFAGIGCLFMIAAAALDFGFTIPPGSAMFIESSLEIGFFGTFVGFLACIPFSIVAMRVLGQARVPSAPVDLQAAEKAFTDAQGVIETETFSADVAEHFGVTQKKKPEFEEPAPAPPPGMKTCPACNAVVGQYQVKCLKCGSALKPGK